MAVLFLDEVHRLTSEVKKNCLQFWIKGILHGWAKPKNKRNVSIKFILQQPKPSINIFENVFKKDPCDISHSSFSRALFERKIQLILSFS